jgi:hypothetical protein
MVATTCPDEVRDRYMAERFRAVGDTYTRCISDNETDKPNKRRNLCKWAAIAHWPGLEACQTKMTLGRNCAEKCPVTQNDIAGLCVWIIGNRHSSH